MMWQLATVALLGTARSATATLPGFDRAAATVAAAAGKVTAAGDAGELQPYRTRVKARAADGEYLIHLIKWAASKNCTGEPEPPTLENPDTYIIPNMCLPTAESDANIFGVSADAKTITIQRFSDVKCQKPAGPPLPLPADLCITEDMKFEVVKGPTPAPKPGTALTKSCGGSEGCASCPFFIEYPCNGQCMLSDESKGVKLNCLAAEKAVEVSEFSDTKCATPEGPSAKLSFNQCQDSISGIILACVPPTTDQLKTPGACTASVCPAGRPCCEFTQGPFKTTNHECCLQGESCIPKVGCRCLGDDCAPRAVPKAEN